MKTLPNRTVEVRALKLQSKRWHQVPEKNQFTRDKTVRAFYSSATGRYDTGLTEDERVFLETQTSFDLNDKFNPDEPHKFWDSKTAGVKLTYGSNFFNLGNPLDYIRFSILKAESTDIVANSLSELERNPDALFVIYDDEEQSEADVKKVDKKANAYVVFSKLTKDHKRKILTLVSDNHVSTKQSDDWIAAKLGGYIESNIDKFLEIAALNKKDLEIRAFIIEAQYKNLLTKEGSSVYYMGDHIGIDMETTIDYFKNPDNQALKIKLMEKLKD